MRRNTEETRKRIKDSLIEADVIDFKFGVVVERHDGLYIDVEITPYVPAEKVKMTIEAAIKEED